MPPDVVGAGLEGGAVDGAVVLEVVAPEPDEHAASATSSAAPSNNL
jgi:hypothetical protein